MREMRGRRREERALEIEVHALSQQHTCGQHRASHDKRAC